MVKLRIKKKYVFLGDCNSINIEVITKAHSLIKNKDNYIILGNIHEFRNYQKKIQSNLSIKKIDDPFNFDQCDTKNLNFFNIENINREKYLNLLNQIKISNFLSNKTGVDLITMPIDKSLFKKKINFVGMTEHLSMINNRKTMMLLHGDKFSTIPLTTHINIKDIHKVIKKQKLKTKINLLLKMIKEKQYNLNFKTIKFLCYNPHCGENRTLGNEDYLIKNTLKLFRNIKGPFSADSAFQKFNKKTLFVSTYHDQALIPFKALNSKMINITLGLKYLRLSPAHGTAKDIKFKNKADIKSYIECMKI